MNDIIENNKLIAEFDGYKNIKGTYWKNGLWITVYNLNYHKVWNRLMPIIEKINNLKIKDYKTSLYIHPNKCYITVTHFSIGGIWSTIKTDLGYMENMYQAVVQFIKWYNEQEKDKLNG